MPSKLKPIYRRKYDILYRRQATAICKIDILSINANWQKNTISFEFISGNKYD